jgi:hypothetical protein
VSCQPRPRQLRASGQAPSMPRVNTWAASCEPFGEPLHYAAAASAP